jgi:DNA-directed RNA polymerase specialized sigma24 family protein
MDESTSPKPEWILTQGAFDQLLACLDTDRERAGGKYELLRRKLVRFFECHGCLFPEDYTDQTINRVARKVAHGERLQNPSSYFYSVARMIFMESLRKQEKEQALLQHQSPPLILEEPGESDRLRCLRHCIQRLPLESRELLVRYYEGEKRVQIENRRKLAEQFRIPLNALRIRACRLRKELETCIDKCLKQQG